MSNKKVKLFQKQASLWQEMLIPGSYSNQKNQTISLTSFWVIFFLIFATLFIRIFQLQVLEGASYRKTAEENRIIARRTSANRGVIYDANNTPLVRNIPSYKRLMPDTLLAQGKFESIDRDKALSLSATNDEWVFFDLKRDYLFGRAIAPVLGYVSQVSKKELENSLDLVSGDLIGKIGIEKLFDERLRGKAGSKLIEANSKGELVRSIGADEPQPGLDVHLTIDLKLQQVLYNALEDKNYIGAAIASDPYTGNILALVTRPAFDPNKIAASLEEENQPFFNRAIAGAYPPGSIFKIISAVAGLEEKAIDSSYTIEDTGEIRIGQYRYGNWYYDQYGKTDGTVDLVKAIQRSNDIYFYKLGEKVGPEALSKWSTLFGLGKTTGLGLVGEVEGLVPSPDWKQKYIGSRWFLGNTYHFAIGQGDLQTTPLQINQAVAVIANGGRLCQPNLILDQASKNSNCQELSISQPTIDLVKKGMVAVCQPEGTAFPFFDFSPKVACKTGTAQFGHPDNLTHAWFTAFAPIEKPEIIITILLEKAGEGSYKAAPVAKIALDYWFNQK